MDELINEYPVVKAATLFLLNDILFLTLYYTLLSYEVFAHYAKLGRGINFYCRSCIKQSILPISFGIPFTLDSSAQLHHCASEIFKRFFMLLDEAGVFLKSNTG